MRSVFVLFPSAVNLPDSDAFSQRREARRHRQHARLFFATFTCRVQDWTLEVFGTHRRHDWTLEVLTYRRHDWTLEVFGTHRRYDRTLEVFGTHCRHDWTLEVFGTSV